MSQPKVFVVTNHAVEQFAHRWLPDHAAWHAEQDLYELLNSAKKIGKTQAGDLIYVSKKRPEIRMVVKDRNVCVTVLPPPEEEVPLEDEESLLMQEHYAELAIRNAGRIAILEKQLQIVDEQREELKLIYRMEIESLQNKKNEINSELSWLKR